MGKKKRIGETPESALFGTKEEYDKMTPEERAKKQKDLEVHWQNNPIMKV